MKTKFGKYVFVIVWNAIVSLSALVVIQSAYHAIARDFGCR